MARFSYRAYGREGETLSGFIDAASEAAARTALTRQGAVPIEVAPQQKPSGRGAGAAGARDVLTLMRQLSTLLRARIALLEVWEIAAVSAPHPDLQRRADAVAQELRAGARLADAWRKAGPPVPEYALKLLEAGEKSGALAQTLSDAAEQMAFQQKILGDLRGALAYPAFLVGAGMAVTLFILAFVVPRFAEIAQSNDADIPGFAAIVLSMGVFTSNNFILVLGLIAAVVVGLVVALRSSAGRQALVNFAALVPFGARLIKDFDIARWSGVMALAMRHGVHLTDALELAKAVVAGPALKAGLVKVERDLREGGALAKSLGERTAMDAADVSIVGAGEAGGDLSESLALVSEQRREAAERRLGAATTFFEPAAIIVVALFVGLIVVSLVLTMTSFYDFAGA